MQRFLERLQITTLCLMLLAVMVGTGHAAERNLKLLVTGNNKAIYPITTDETTPEQTTEAFEKELRELRRKNPDALMIEAGNFISITSSLETAYNLAPVQLHEELEYDVVNLSATDAALGTVVGIGYHEASKAHIEPLITTFYTRQPKPIDGLKTSINVDVPDFGTVTAMSFSSEQAMSGLSGKTADLDPPMGLQRQESILRRSANQNSFLIAVSEMTDEELKGALGNASLSGLTIDHRNGEAGELEERDGYVSIRAPRAGQILELDLVIDDQNAVTDHEVKLHDSFDSELVANQPKFPIGRIGLRIPNIDSLAKTLMGYEPDNIYFEQVPSAGKFEDISSLPEIAVYHLESKTQGNKRLYRIFTIMPNYLIEGNTDSGYPNIDMIAVLGENGNLERVINRTNFPVGLTATGLLDALNGLVGTDPENWKANPTKVGGIEPLWDWTTGDLRKVLQLDSDLYGAEGMLSKAAD